MQTREAVGASPAARDRSILRASASERHAAWHMCGSVVAGGVVVGATTGIVACSS